MNVEKPRLQMNICTSIDLIENAYVITPVIVRSHEDVASRLENSYQMYALLWPT
jgi:hypothetical protein